MQTNRREKRTVTQNQNYKMKKIQKKKTVMKVESENYRKVKSESQKKRTMS